LRKLVHEELGEAVPMGEVTVPAASAAVPAPAYRIRKSYADRLHALGKRIAVSKGIDHAMVQNQINQHIGVSKRANASIEKLQAGIAYATRLLAEDR
jgi:hypothetical protein